jgi:hypothetical protein
VTREELRQRLWDHDTFVDFDHSLNISINKLRDALGDSAANPRSLRPCHGRVTDFLAAVSVEEVRESHSCTPLRDQPADRSCALRRTGATASKYPLQSAQDSGSGLQYSCWPLWLSEGWFWWKQETATKGTQTVASCLLSFHLKINRRQRAMISLLPAAR